MGGKSGILGPEKAGAVIDGQAVKWGKSRQIRA
jgi:hypothetical protein